MGVVELGTGLRVGGVGEGFGDAEALSLIERARNEPVGEQRVDVGACLGGEFPSGWAAQRGRGLADPGHSGVVADRGCGLEQGGQGPA